jgi:hypothetical protein
MKDETRVWLSYSALPQAIPDQALCHEALNIARRVRDFVHGIMKSGKVG